MNQVDPPHLFENLLKGKINLVYKEVEKLSLETLDDLKKIKLFAIKMYVYRQRAWVTEGLELIDRHLKNDKTLPIGKSFLLNIKSRFLISIDRNKEALRIIDTVNSNLSKTDTGENQVYGQLTVMNRLLKSIYYARVHDYNLALNYAKEAYHLLQEHNDEFVKLSLYSHWSRIYLELGEIEDAFDTINEYLTQIPSEDYYLLRISALTEKASIHVANSELDLAMKLINEAENLSAEVDALSLKFDVLNTKATVTRFKGDPETTKALQEETLRIAKAMDSKLMTAIAHNNLGITLTSVGEVDEALENLFLSLDVNEFLDRKESIGTSYNNIAIIYIMKGELDRALEFLTKSKEIAEETGTEKSRATAYVNLGQIYHMKGMYDEAAEYYHKCLEIDEQYGNDVYLSESIYNLLTLYVEVDELERANEYLTELKEINNRIDNKIVNLRYRLGKMQILKSSNRALKKAKAQEILLDVVEEDPIDFELYVSALLNLCEILLVELKQTGEDEVLKEIKEYVDILHDYAVSQQSFMYMAESYLIKSKIAQLELDFQEAKHLIERAEQVSLNKGLDKLAMKISSHHDNLLEQMKSMDDLYEENSSLKERLEQVQLEDLFLRMINTKTEEMKSTPEMPTMFLIIQAGGTTLYRRVFQKMSGVNQDLVSGLFSALYTISDEVFNTKASTQRIKHEDYTIIMKPIQDDFIFCYVFKGESFNALKKLEMVVRSIKDSTTIWNALNRDISHLTEMEKQGMHLIVDSIFN